MTEVATARIKVRKNDAFFGHHFGDWCDAISGISGKFGPYQFGPIIPIRILPILIQTNSAKVRIRYTILNPSALSIQPRILK